MSYQLSENTIKGRIAEAIVEEMFLAMGYEVYRYGVESLVPNFLNRLSKKKGNVAEKIRTMPDFIINKDDKIFFIEVKYRWDNVFNLKEFCIKKDIIPYPYPDSYIVLVSKKFITIQKAQKLWSGEDFVYLTEVEELDVDEKVVRQCVQFAKRCFEQL